MPCTPVRWMSFSAPTAAATSPATRSALMLYVSPAAPIPTGAMTGIYPFSSRSRMGAAFTPVTSPTRPMSTDSPSAVRCRRRRAVSRFASLPDSPMAVQVDEADNLLVDLAHQHHLDDLHRLLVSDAHAAHEARLLAQPLHEGADLRSPAVHDDGIDADQLQQDDVEREGLLEVRLVHGGAAILDDDGLAPELPDVRERLHEDLDPAHVGRRGHRMYRERSWSRMMSCRRSRTYSASIVSSLPGWSGASNEISSSSFSMIVYRRRAPMFSVLAFTRIAMSAMASTASGRKVSPTFSVFSSSMYWRINAF